MNFLDEISVLILTYNEEQNIARTLEALTDFTDVVVLDSGSSDSTLDIVSEYPNARVVSRPFDSHAMQWNYGLFATGTHRNWVLALDADYVVSKRLIAEIGSLRPESTTSGYRIGFRYCVFGRPLSGSLYPPNIALFKRDRAHFIQEGHTQRAVVVGDIHSLQGKIDHDDRKPLSRWLASQANYARIEADHLSDMPWRHLKFQGKVRRLIVVAPLLVPVYCLSIRRGFLDGWPGLYYAMQRGIAEAILAIHLLERKFSVTSSQNFATVQK